MHKVLIDGVEYIPAKEAIANRDAVIRGLMSHYLGELGEEYNEHDRCHDVYVIVTDDPSGYHNPKYTPNVIRVADEIAKRSK